MKELSRHHIHELVKVDSSGPVCVDLLDDSVDLLVSQLGVQLTKDLLRAGFICVQLWRGISV